MNKLFYLLSTSYALLNCINSGIAAPGLSHTPWEVPPMRSGIRTQISQRLAPELSLPHISIKKTQHGHTILNLRNSTQAKRIQGAFNNMLPYYQKATSINRDPRRTNQLFIPKTTWNHILNARNLSHLQKSYNRLPADYNASRPHVGSSQLPARPYYINQAPAALGVRKQLNVALHNNYNMPFVPIKKVGADVFAFQAGNVAKANKLINSFNTNFGTGQYTYADQKGTVFMSQIELNKVLRQTNLSHLEPAYSRLSNDYTGANTPVSQTGVRRQVGSALNNTYGVPIMPMKITSQGTVFQAANQKQAMNVQGMLQQNFSTGHISVDPRHPNHVFVSKNTMNDIILPQIGRTDLQKPYQHLKADYQAPHVATKTATPAASHNDWFNQPAVTKQAATYPTQVQSTTDQSSDYVPVRQTIFSSLKQEGLPVAGHIALKKTYSGNMIMQAANPAEAERIQQFLNDKFNISGGEVGINTRRGRSNEVYVNQNALNQILHETGNSGLTHLYKKVHADYR